MGSLELSRIFSGAGGAEVLVCKMSNTENKKKDKFMNGKREWQRNTSMIRWVIQSRKEVRGETGLESTV